MTHLADDKDRIKQDLIHINQVGSEKVIEMDHAIKRLAELRKYESEAFEIERKRLEEHCQIVLEDLDAQFYLDWD